MTEKLCKAADESVTNVLEDWDARVYDDFMEELRHTVHQLGSVPHTSLPQRRTLLQHFRRTVCEEVEATVAHEIGKLEELDDIKSKFRQLVAGFVAATNVVEMQYDANARILNAKVVEDGNTFSTVLHLHRDCSVSEKTFDSDGDKVSAWDFDDVEAFVRFVNNG